MIKSFYFVSFIMVCHVSNAQCKNAAPEENCPFSIDSLKWKMYSLTYDVKLKKRINKGTHFEKQDDSTFSAVECDIEIERIEEKGDTAQYFLSFTRNDPTHDYVQLKADSYVGIGYVKSLCIYFPIPGQSAFDVQLSFYSYFFQKQDRAFIKYLKHYHGNFSTWVKQACLDKKIL